MKQYLIEINDDLSAIYEDIAKMSTMPVEEVMRRILKKVIETMLRDTAEPNQDEE